MGEAATADQKAGVGLRRRLLLTGGVAMGLLSGYGGRAYAACTVVSGTTYLCSGAETTTQTIAADNAAVVTAPGFSVDTSGTGGNAITITGDGALSYDDAEGAPLTGAGYGLYINSGGDDGALPGSVSVNATGAIAGGYSGIVAHSYGGGPLAVTVQGAVTGAAYYGIHAVNAGGTHLRVTTGPGAVYGGGIGILATNLGSGDLAIAVGGDVEGGYGSAISAAGLGSALTVTTASGTTLIGGEHGISARNFGSGALRIAVGGTVGGALHGIYAANSAGTDLTISTAAGAIVAGGAYDGIYAVNGGSGALTISAGGTVSGGAAGIHAENAGTDLVVTGGAGGVIAGGAIGIYGVNHGSGSLRIAIEGDVAGSDLGILALNDADAENLELSIGTEARVTGDAGIFAGNDGSGSLGVTVAGTVDAATVGIYAYTLGENLDVTTQAGSRVAGGDAGIVALNAGSGALTIAANGDVEGGIVALGATDITVTTGPGSTVRNSYFGITAINVGSGATTIAVEGDVVSDLAGILAFAGGTDLTVTTAAGTTVSGGTVGVVATNAGSGATTVVIGGAVSGAGYGLAAYGRSGLDITLEEGSGVRGAYAGVYAGTYSGPLSITVEGEITVDDGTGLRASSYSDGPMTVAVGRHGSIVNEGADPSFFALDLSGAPANVTLAGNIRSESGGALRFDTFAPFDDRLELQPGFSVTGDVLAGPGNDTLVFGGEGQASFDAGLIGPGSQFRDFERLRKEGQSHWTLTGSSGAVTDFTLDEGLLAVNGTLPNARILVSSRGTLGGSGSVGSVVLGGGTVAPGNSIGTLTVGGDVDFSGGGVFEVEVDAAGEADRLDAGGTVTLSGGSLRVVPLASLQELGKSSDYTILTADGGLVGSFDSLSSTLAFLIPTLSQAGNSLFLNLTRLSFASVGETPNQTAVGAALDEVVDSGTTALDEVFDALLQLSPDGARQALDSLGGVQHTHAQALALEAGRQFQDAVLDRLGGRGGTGDIGGLGLALEDAGPARQLAAAGTGDDARGGALGEANRGLWVRGLGGFGSLDDSDNASGADYRSGGLVLGADGRVSDELVAGVALGYLRTDIDAAGADLDLDSFQLAGYGGWRHQAYYLQGVASVGYHGIDAVRGVTAGGFSDTAAADYDGWTGGLAAEAGRDFALGAATLTPFAGLEYSHLRRDGFTESGAGAADLSVESEDQDSLRSSLGLRLGHSFETAGGLEIRPVVEAAWVRENLDDVSALDAGFAAAPGSAFRISGPELDRDRALLGAGVAAELGDGLRLGISYRGELAASDRSHSLAASLRWRF